MSRWSKGRLILGVLAGLLMFNGVGCLPVPQQTDVTDTPTPTVTITSTVTPTTIWFPATDTPTPVPVKAIGTPTAPSRPVSSELLIVDTFTEQTRWLAFRNENGSAAYGNDELTLSVNTPRRVVSSFFQETVPNNYYLEIDVNPSLCKGEDMYGLLLRASSEQETYRFTLNCMGLLRFEWAHSNMVVPLQDWTPSGQVRSGAPQTLRLGVWAMWDKMRIYVDDIFQFQVNQLINLDGGMGVFVRSSGDTVLTVNYSNLKIFEGVEFPVQPTPTQTVEPSATPTIRIPDVNP